MLIYAAGSWRRKQKLFIIDPMSMRWKSVLMSAVIMVELCLKNSIERSNTDVNSVVSQQNWTKTAKLKNLLTFGVKFSDTNSNAIKKHIKHVHYELVHQCHLMQISIMILIL